MAIEKLWSWQISHQQIPTYFWRSSNFFFSTLQIIISDCIPGIKIFSSYWTVNYYPPKDPITLYSKSNLGYLELLLKGPLLSNILEFDWLLLTSFSFLISLLIYDFSVFVLKFFSSLIGGYLANYFSKLSSSLFIPGPTISIS